MESNKELRLQMNAVLDSANISGYLISALKRNESYKKINKAHYSTGRLNMGNHKV